MRALLALSRGIDGVTTRLGRAVAWLIVAAILVSAGNALVRKLFNTSSNAWLELQWWMFGAVFLLAAPWTLADNAHIRIDVLSSRQSQRVRDGIDVVGHALFLMPFAAVVLVTAWPYFLRAYVGNEQSSNAGGLAQWPPKLLIPLAFALLLAQALSELIKRIAVMRGVWPTPPPTSRGPAAEVGDADRPARQRAS